jgi:GTPase
MIVDAEEQLTETAIDHLKLSLAFNVPIMIAITKIDRVLPDKLFDTYQ